MPPYSHFHSTVLKVVLLPYAATAASPSWMAAHDAEICQIVGQMTQSDLGSIKDLNDVKTIFLSCSFESATSLRNLPATMRNLTPGDSHGLRIGLQDPGGSLILKSMMCCQLPDCYDSKPCQP